MWLLVQNVKQKCYTVWYHSFVTSLQKNCWRGVSKVRDEVHTAIKMTMLLGRYTYESTRRHNREQHRQRCKTIVFKIVQVCLCLNVRLTLHSSQRNRLWRFKLIWDDPKWGLTAVCEQGHYSLDPRTAGSFVSWMTMNCSMRILSCGVRGLQVWLTADFSGIHSKVTLPKMSLFETFSFSWHGYCSAPNTGGQWSLSKNSHRTPTLFPA